MEAALEVLPVDGRGRRKRKWQDEVKARIVAETLMPGGERERCGAPARLACKPCIIVADAGAERASGAASAGGPGGICGADGRPG